MQTKRATPGRAIDRLARLGENGIRNMLACVLASVVVTGCVAAPDGSPDDDGKQDESAWGFYRINILSDPFGNTRDGQIYVVTRANSAQLRCPRDGMADACFTDHIDVEGLALTAAERSVMNARIAVALDDGGGDLTDFIVKARLVAHPDNAGETYPFDLVIDELYAQVGPRRAVTGTATVNRVSDNGQACEEPSLPRCTPFTVESLNSDQSLRVNFVSYPDAATDERAFTELTDQRDVIINAAPVEDGVLGMEAAEVFFRIDATSRR